MVRILTITDSLSERAGGLSHATLNLAKSTAIQWPEASFIILSQEDGPQLGYLNSLPANLNIKTINCFRNPIYPWSKGLVDLIDSINPDLVHLRGLWRQPSLACYMWKKSNPEKPLIVQTAGMLEPWARKRNQWLKTVYYQFIERKLISQCDVIHATSLQEVSTLHCLGLDSRKIRLIEEGVFMPPRDKISTSKTVSPRKLLFLSRLHPVKGVEMLLEALAMLRPRGWICQIAGMGNPSYEYYLRKRTERLHLQNLVTFLGPISGQEKHRVLAEADAFVLPSFSESFGIAIAEAMSWGLPVLTTSATPWHVISDERLGWIVNPNLNSLSRALFELCLSSPEDLSIMGQKSRQYIMQNYDWCVISAKMAALYQELLSAA